MKAVDVVNRALSEIGITEYPPNSNNVKYNTAYYGHPVSGVAYPWCCTFVWWVLSTCEVPVLKTASCMMMGDYYKKQGRWFTSDPQVGDLVFFKYSTNNRWTNHIGIVVEVKGNEITTVEGNTSINSNDNGGSVMRRKRSKNIVGYGRPKYDDATNIVIETPDENGDAVQTDITVKPILKRGSKGQYVRAWQVYLKTCNIDVGTIDGDFGKKTEAAVKEWQLAHGLDPDGIIGKATWASIGL